MIYIEGRQLPGHYRAQSRDNPRHDMISLAEAGLLRELQAIITLYLGTLLGGYSMGFSAIAIPDMKNEMRN